MMGAVLLLLLRLCHIIMKPISDILSFCLTILRFFKTYF